MNSDKKRKDKDNFYSPVNISAIPFDTTPETALEMVNTYGTYEIQPTAVSDSTFPAIAQGIAKQDCPDLEFHRDGSDQNPASDRFGQDD